MAEPTSFAEFLPQLVAARKDRGWSREQVAAELGMKISAVNSWERGHRVPARANAVRWAELLQVELPADTTGWFSKDTYRAVAEHGTRSGAQKHRKQHEPVCQPCLDAEAAYARDWRARPERRAA